MKCSLPKWDVQRLKNESPVLTKWLMGENYNKLHLFVRDDSKQGSQLLSSLKSEEENTFNFRESDKIRACRCHIKAKYMLTVQRMWLIETECEHGPHADFDPICCQPSRRDQRHLAILGGECAACGRIHSLLACCSHCVLVKHFTFWFWLISVL